ncbi:hypothetical protein XarbCFBP8138_04260 [Xanthomonas arboricola]|uniref:hypothetical protein n=1 Tax=Xanthomonas arboricola TaxID=56448 RepID=UPI0007EE0E61|nr:hypothetical protein [Xanthomonas arboricola]MBB6258634.1 hypothetical protein [Xanthomonas arboricola]NIK33662.1 hypothetical protein [Xanthomonas arboricola]OBR75373.1 hypothetical protein A7D01_10090 [Xanthomonas arboricola]PPT57264.1 hypothetical protein XarbCFBP8138_04260 [Xanthomonas arboricola]
MSNDENGNRGVDDPTPPNGIKAPGRDNTPIQEGPAQDSEIDDDDGIEDPVEDDDDLGAEDDEDDEDDDQ